MIALATLITGCKKDNKDVTVTTPSNTKPNDLQGSSEADEAIANANDLINNKVGGGANQKVSAYNLPCGIVSVDSSTTSGGNKIYKMKYGSQTPCGYKKKSGEVSFVLTNGTSYKDAGAVFTITFTNYVVEIVATGNIVTLNGTISVTNVSGGYIWEPLINNSTVITHKVRGNFSITYPDNTVRSRSYYQLRTWKSTTTAPNWSGLSLTIAGDTLTGVSELGRTYEGNYEYNTQILTDYKWENSTTSYAGPYVLTTGHARLNVTIPLVSPTYIDVEGGYYWNYSSATSMPTLINNTTANAYKITTVISTASTTQYQLY